MVKIELTQGKFALVDDSDADIGNNKWYYVHGYAGRWIGGRNKPKFLYMHRVIMGEPTGKQVDHINGGTIDNRRSNLRVATRSENLRNRGATKANKLGIKGVYHDPHRNQYTVRLQWDGKLQYLGRYTNIASAVMVRDAFIVAHHKEFAHF